MFAQKMNLNLLLNQDISFFLGKHCRSRSAGFSQSQLIRIYTVFHSDEKFMLTAEIQQIKRMKIEEGST